MSPLAGLKNLRWLVLLPRLRRGLNDCARFAGCQATTDFRLTLMGPEPWVERPSPCLRRPSPARAGEGRRRRGEGGLEVPRLTVGYILSPALAGRVLERTYDSGH